MIKFVNGEEVEMTPDEIAAREAEEAAWEAKKAQYEAQEKYKDDRRTKLIQIDGEGMDAIRKAIVAFAAGDPVPEEFTAYQAKVDAIKAEYPKS